MKINIYLISPLKLIYVMASLFILTSLTGCLGTTHQFRKGDLLNSGESEINWGFSYTTVAICDSDGDRYKDSDGYSRCNGVWKEQDSPIISRSFRLGLRDEWGPFTGVEIGYQFEIPHTLDFDLRLGLPHISLSKNKIIKHAIGAGWGLGLYADNTYFIDYAISYDPDSNISLYATFRESLLATQITDFNFEDEPQESSDLYNHQRRLYHQASIGVEFRLGEIFILPDQIHFQILTSAPRLGAISQPNPDGELGYFHTQLNIGMGWHY